MCLKLRVRLTMLLAGVLYVAVVSAGMAGFDATAWAGGTVAFLLWHVLIHLPAGGPRPSFAVSVVVLGALSAGCVGLGHLLGNWLALRPDPVIALGVAFGVVALARMLRIPPEEAAEMNAFLDEAEAELQRARGGRRGNGGEAPAGLSGEGLAAVDEVLDEVGSLSAAGADAARLAPFVARLAEAGPPLPVLERLAQGGARHLPRIQLHAAFALSPGPARGLFGDYSIGKAVERVLDTGNGRAIRQMAQDAMALCEVMPEAPHDLPWREDIAAHAARWESRDSDVAEALGRLQQCLRSRDDA